METYIGGMKDLINQGLGTSTPNSLQVQIARERTITTLRRLDAQRNGVVLRFLQGAHLIGGQDAVINLRAADLSYDDLGNARLSGTDLRNANLSHANLTGANLTGAIMNDADLTSADLSGATLTAASLSDASLTSMIHPGDLAAVGALSAGVV